MYVCLTLKNIPEDKVDDTIHVLRFWIKEILVMFYFGLMSISIIYDINLILWTLYSKCTHFKGITVRQFDEILIISLLCLNVLWNYLKLNNKKSQLLKPALNSTLSSSTWNLWMNLNAWQFTYQTTGHPVTSRVVELEEPD